MAFDFNTIIDEGADALNASLGAKITNATEKAAIADAFQAIGEFFNRLGADLAAAPAPSAKSAQASS